MPALPHHHKVYYRQNKITRHRKKGKADKNTQNPAPRFHLPSFIRRPSLPRTFWRRHGFWSSSSPQARAAIWSVASSLRVSTHTAELRTLQGGGRLSCEGTKTAHGQGVSFDGCARKRYAGSVNRDGSKHRNGKRDNKKTTTQKRVVPSSIVSDYQVIYSSRGAFTTLSMPLTRHLRFA